MELPVQIAKIKEILNQFEPIDLEAMGSSALMNRMDQKYVFPFARLAEVLDAVKADYRVLVVQGQYLSEYHTLYYDTPDLDLYLKHHNGKLNRYKVRHRTYVNSKLGFLEVKFKNNKGRTIKTRIASQAGSSQIDPNEQRFLSTQLPFDPQQLRPAIGIDYIRVTLVSKTSVERVTLDFELKFERQGIHEALPALVIAEVKQDRKNASPFIQIMKDQRFKFGSMSKYCMGIALTEKHIRKNLFKQKIHQLKSI